MAAAAPVLYLIPCLSVSLSLSLLVLCTDCRELKELAGTVFQMT